VKQWAGWRASRFAILFALFATSHLALAPRAIAAAAASKAAGNAAPAWKSGSNWIMLRAGYAKAQGQDEPDGAGGYGFGFRHMLSDRMSLGLNVQHDLLGTFGAASKIEVPVVLEMLWHFHWSAGLYPYVGGGVGAAWRKTYRTGADQSGWQPMYAFNLGSDFPIGKNSALGLDLRMEGVSSDQLEPNPVFGPEEPRSVHWSFKLTYAVTY
jgi:outer membrane protein W